MIDQSIRSSVRDEAEKLRSCEAAEACCVLSGCGSRYERRECRRAVLSGGLGVK